MNVEVGEGEKGCHEAFPQQNTQGKTERNVSVRRSFLVKKFSQVRELQELSFFIACLGKDGQGRCRMVGME